MASNDRRLKRAKRARFYLSKNKHHLIIFRSLKNIYAQLINPEGRIITQASTLDKEIKTFLKYGGNQKAASAIGKLIAERALKLDIHEVCFDCSGFKYHGRVKCLAEAAREQGLRF